MTGFGIIWPLHLIESRPDVLKLCVFVRFFKSGYNAVIGKVIEPLDIRVFEVQFECLRINQTSESSCVLTEAL